METTPRLVPYQTTILQKTDTVFVPHKCISASVEEKLLVLRLAPPIRTFFCSYGSASGLAVNRHRTGWYY
jgi:hypothetical protein